jgi:hypothetical protein
MSQLANESHFDAEYQKISDRYEACKDKINNVVMVVKGEDQQDLVRALELLVELRDLACLHLKAQHNVPPN